LRHSLNTFTVSDLVLKVVVLVSVLIINILVLVFLCRDLGLGFEFDPDCLGPSVVVVDVGVLMNY